MQANEIKGQVDFGIITIREDEFAAVLDRFPPEQHARGRRRYSICHVQAGFGEAYLVAVVRCPSQGNGEAQNVARDMIDDLDPQWLVLVGIAGSVPDDEFTLGDVVVATRVYDFCVQATLQDRPSEFSIAGGGMHPNVQALVAHLPAMRAQLEGWNEESSISKPRPRANLRASNFYGSPAWQAKTKAALKTHFGRSVPSRQPIVTARPIAAGDQLMKDTDTLQIWRQTARHIGAIEMELAGVYHAARRPEREYPILAIRGISDIVGYKRHRDWTTYACHSAAAFAHALIRARPIEAYAKVRASRALPTFEVGECTEGSPSEMQCTGEIIGGLEAATRVVEEIDLDTEPTDDQRFNVHVTAIERIRSYMEGSDKETRHKLRMALLDWERRLERFKVSVEFVLWNSVFRRTSKVTYSKAAAETICGLAKHCFDIPSLPVTWWMWYGKEKETIQIFKVTESTKESMETGYYENDYVNRIRGLFDSREYSLGFFDPNVLHEYVLPNLLIYVANKKGAGASQAVTDRYLDVSQWRWSINDPLKFVRWE